MTEPATTMDTLLATTEAELTAAVERCLELMAEARASGTGIGQAADELTKARRALELFQRQQLADRGGRFTTIVDAVRWTMAEGYLVKERSAQDHIKARVPRQKDGTWLLKDVEEYARRTWQNPSREAPAQLRAVDHGERLKKALADERELKVAQLKGNMLDAAEEEARDAAVLLGVRQHLETAAPDRAKAIVAEIAAVLSDEQRGALTARLPELIERDLERIADCFDRLARAGGVGDAVDG